MHLDPKGAQRMKAPTAGLRARDGTRLDYLVRSSSFWKRSLLLTLRRY
jgi:hypothetical protein